MVFKLSNEYSLNLHNQFFFFLFLNMKILSKSNMKRNFSCSSGDAEFIIKFN